MLLTDSDVITAAGLATIDPETTTIATNLGITMSGASNPQTLSAEPSIIDRAISGACGEITSSFQNFSGYLVGIGMNSAHVAAVLNTLSTSINRPRMQMNQVVAAEPNPANHNFRRWLEYKALYEFFRAAFRRKLEDKYEKKMNLWASEQQRAWYALLASGIPVVISPLPCPGAIREFNPGTWNNANLAAVGSGSADPGSSYDVAITWTNSTGYVSPTQRGNSESAPSSTLSSFAVAAGKFLQVSIASLNAPGSTINSAIGTASGIYTPLAATHWNIYVGSPGGVLYLQNAAPIAIATTSYTFAAVPNVTATYPVWIGQAPDYNFAFQNMLHRA